MDEISITPANETDREWAALLMARSEPWTRLGRTLEDCRRSLHYPEDLLFMARHAGKPRAFLLLRPRGVAGEPYIVRIAVDERFRSSGIGTKLMAFSEDHFRAQSPHIFLCVSSFNVRAHALYERLGYNVVGEFPDHAVAGASEILMHKRLR